MKAPQYLIRAPKPPCLLVRGWWLSPLFPLTLLLLLSLDFFGLFRLVFLLLLFLSLLLLLLLPLDFFGLFRLVLLLLLFLLACKFTRQRLFFLKQPRVVGVLSLIWRHMSFHVWIPFLAVSIFR